MKPKRSSLNVILNPEKVKGNGNGRQKGRMKKRRRKALQELDDIHDSLCRLLKETSKSICGFECALDVVANQIKTIRKGIVKK